MKKLILAISVISLFTETNANTTIKIPSDINAEYTVINKGGSKSKPTLTTKRVGSSGINYSKRLFDCQAGLTKYLGTGDTLDEMNKSMPDPQMSELVQGSIAYYQWKYACNR